MEKVKYSNFGWLPAKEMKPYNNHTVVMMVEQNGDIPLVERLGYYENGEWVTLSEKIVEMKCWKKLE